MIIGKSSVNNSGLAEDLQDLVDQGALTLQVQVSPSSLLSCLVCHLKIHPEFNGALANGNSSFKRKSKK